MHEKTIASQEEMASSESRDKDVFLGFVPCYRKQNRPGVAEWEQELRIAEQVGLTTFMMAGTRTIL